MRVATRNPCATYDELLRDLAAGPTRRGNGGTDFLGDAVVLNIHTILAPWRATAATVLLVAAAFALATLPRPATSATVTYAGAGCTSFVVAGTPPNQTVTCSHGSSNGVPVCVPTANPVTPAAGTTTTITANCSNQPTTNSYIWTGGPCTLQVGPTCVVGKSRATSVLYSVKATNPSGTGVAADITITWH
jgi:hypothetical protein